MNKTSKKIFKILACKIVALGFGKIGLDTNVKSLLLFTTSGTAR